MSTLVDKEASLQEQLDEYLELRKEQRRLREELEASGVTLSSSSSDDEEAEEIQRNVQMIKAIPKQSQVFKESQAFDPDHDPDDINYFIAASDALGRDIIEWKKQALCPVNQEHEECAGPGQAVKGMDHMRETCGEKSMICDTPSTKHVMPTACKDGGTMDATSTGKADCGLTQTAMEKMKLGAKAQGDDKAARLMWVEHAHGFIRDVDHLPGGLVVAAWSGGLCVYDHNHDNRAGRAINHPLVEICKGNCMGVCVDMRGSTVAVTDDRGDDPGILHIMRKAWGRWQHQEYQICVWPWRVAMMTDRHVIVVSLDNHLYKYTVQGVQVWKRQLSDVYDVAVDRQGRLLVCHDDHVTVYDGDGQEKYSFPEPTSQDKLALRAICVDGSDNILVWDMKSNSVMMYSGSGYYIRRLSVLELDREPRCMALSDDGRLAVGLYGDTTLSVYQI